MQNGGADYLKNLWKDQKKRKKLSEKVSKIWLSKTPEEIREIRKKASKRYTYQNEYFDSSWELAFYIYCKDQKLNISREPKSFSFIFNQKFHTYIPDFEVENQLIEIKGDQYLDKKTNKWKSFFDSSQDALYEAKHQCALQNNVKILYSKDCQKYLDYIDEKYGKNYLQQFRNT